MKDMEKKVLVAYRKVHEAEMALHCVVEEAYPVGSEVTWTTTRNALSYEQRGVVLYLRYTGEVKVRNLKTGAESWHSARYLSYAPL